MKGQAFQTIFLFTFLVAIATIASYVILNIYLKTSGAAMAKTSLIQQQSQTPQFAIHDAEYNEYGSVAIVSFTLYNIGSSNIPLEGWTLDFTDKNGDTFCSIPYLFENLATNQNLTVVATVYDVNTHQKLSYGQAIPAHTIAEVNVTILPGNSCFNTTVNWSTSHETMGIRVTINPTQYLDLMSCTVNPSTGYGSCSSVGYQTLS